MNRGDEMTKDRKGKSADPVCGNCNKPYSEHFKERETYCFTHATGDIFTDESQEI